MMKKRDLLIIVLVLVAALGAYAYTQSKPAEKVTIPANAGRVEPTGPVETDAPNATDAPRTADTPDETADAQRETPPATAEPAAVSAQSAAVGPPVPQRVQTDNYVVIEVNGKCWGDPIPMDMDKEITVKQENGAVNVVSITPKSVKMHSSTCENQDCVYQDEIPINYIETNRILGNLIVCLPNQVVLRLVTGEEAAP